MSVRAASHLTLISCCLILLIACLTDGAPTTATGTSASASKSSSQRTARSASRLELEEEPNEDGKKEDCSTDFVENFFRVLSGPVGKEAEALVAAVLKLLSENDRVNWPRLTDQIRMKPPHSPAHSSPSFASPAREPLVQTKPRIYHQLSAFTGAKRMSPKFNPTGWRRKRDVGAAWQGILQRFLKQYDETPVALETSDKPSAIFDEDDISADLLPESAEWPRRKAENAEWRQRGPEKRNEGRIYRRLVVQLKPKRKPLEFNPTGW